jgi:hypothetical protein
MGVTYTFSMTMQARKRCCVHFFSVHTDDMKTASDIIEAAGGRTQVALVFRVSPRHVSNAIGDGKLPASWFHTLEKMTEAELPRHLFTFKGDA